LNFCGQYTMCMFGQGGGPRDEANREQEHEQPKAVRFENERP
jgi:hypothetical protein